MYANKKLVIYPTSRAVRSHITNILSQNTLLPKIITIGEFENKVILVKGKTFIDQDTRTLLLNEAAAFTTFSHLHIDREFFTFLKNARFLFGFFDELSIELVDIQTLKSFDTYADYAEHIDILSTLLQKYKSLLAVKGYVDKITLPDYYEINHAYLKNIDSIELHLEGYLNRFEFALFCDIAEKKSFTITLTTNFFNQKMIDTFKTVGIELDLNHEYTIDLSNKTILSQTPMTASDTQFITSSCENELEQVAFVKKQLYDYINAGIDPEKIAVVLPSASFAKKLDLFDDENNFNFAMGVSFDTTELYQKLNALYQYYSEQNHQNSYRANRFKLPEALLSTLLIDWKKLYTTEELHTIFQSLIDEKSKEEEKQIYLEELHLFSNLFPALAHYPFHKIFHLFLTRLSSRSIDDTRGGKVTVMEVLETRGVQYDAVILVNFNEGTVPTTSQKDLFLSSEIRALASLPTTSDRENLQKYYYKRLFDNAKYVAISYVENEQNQPSRFLDELSILKSTHNYKNLSSILLRNNDPLSHFHQEDLIAEYDFEKVTLSASGLKTFLECKRRYHLRYIAGIKEFEIPKDDDSDRRIGEILHKGLEETYSQVKGFSDPKDFLFTLQSHLYQKSSDSKNLRFLVDIWLQKLTPMAELEASRFKEGYRVKFTEQKFEKKFDGFTLTGTIDRIDERENFVEVIDYKSGKIPSETKKTLENPTNFQLQFYHLLLSPENDVRQSYYYDLSRGKLIADKHFDVKLDRLYSTLDDLRIKEHNFTMTEDHKFCLYCPYQRICNRIM